MLSEKMIMKKSSFRRYNSSKLHGYYLLPIFFLSSHFHLHTKFEVSSNELWLADKNDPPPLPGPERVLKSPVQKTKIMLRGYGLSLSKSSGIALES